MRGKSQSGRGVGDGGWGVGWGGDPPAMTSALRVRRLTSGAGQNLVRVALMRGEFSGGGVGWGGGITALYNRLGAGENANA